MRPSSWNGVGAMAKVPSALLVSFVIDPSALSRRFAKPGGPGLSYLEPPCAHLDLFVGKENLAGVFEDVPWAPAAVRRLPTLLLHHAHLADAARTGHAEHLSGLVAGEIADHV